MSPSTTHMEGRVNRETRRMTSKKVFVVGDDNKPTIHLYYHDEHYKLLRYEWPWSWFQKVTNYKSSCDGFEEFEEHHKMWLASQVDSYKFVQDNNNLFHNLMQGLVIVGASKPSQSNQIISAHPSRNET